MDILKANFEFGGITYLVCSNGDIFGPTGKKLKPRKNSDGYLVVTMGKSSIQRSTKFVHRIVAELFLPTANLLHTLSSKKLIHNEWLQSGRDWQPSLLDTSQRRYRLPYIQRNSIQRSTAGPKRANGQIH